jgi:hypothetical protein
MQNKLLEVDRLRQEQFVLALELVEWGLQELRVTLVVAVVVPAVVVDLFI